MTAVIREIPSPKWVIFYDIELAFIPFDGKLWLSQSDICSALSKTGNPSPTGGLCFPRELEHIDAREHSWFYNLKLARHRIKAEPYFALSAIQHYLQNNTFLGRDHDGLYRRFDGFYSVLNELEALPHPAPLLHSHSCGVEARHL